MRPHFTCRVGLFVSLCWLSSFALAQDIFVDASAAGLNNGTSWTNAYTRLQDALRETRMGPKRIIWVADGTYYPDEGIGIVLGNRSASFTLDVAGVQIYGGFAGGETLLSQRNVQNNAAILSGDLSGPAGNDLPGFGNRGDNSFHVVLGTAGSPGTRLDGFTVRGGHGDGGFPNASGGGILTLSGANITIANCLITDNDVNDQGGGAFFFFTTVRLANSTFYANRSSVAGGGLFFFDPAGVKTVTGCSFISNTTGFGGGGGLGGATNALTLVNSVFIKNSCGSQNPGPNTGLGGGVAVAGGTPNIVNCTFASNTTTGRGGAGLAVTAGGVAVQPTISNCIFWQNQDNLSTDETAQISRWSGASPTPPVPLVRETLVDAVLVALAGNGNVAGDPIFADLDGCDDILGTLDDDARLTAASILPLNNGNATFLPPDTLDLDGDTITAEPTPVDRDGEARVQGPEVDMGAYEGISTPGGPVAINCPPDATVECGGDTSTGALGSATATGCGSITVSFSDASSPGCGNTETITRTWTATNGSNSAMCAQTITVQDTTPPTLSVPANATVECGADSNPAATGSATGSDSCGGVTITFSDASTPGCGNSGTITRTWTATDDCGNPTSGDQIITVADTTAPTLSVPVDATVECGGDTSPAATGTATGSDGCGGVVISHSDVSVPGCGNTLVITRTWTATDDCGNPTSGDQTITVVDTTAPTLSVPADTTVECGGDTSPAATGSATGSDTCGGVTITSSDAMVAGCGNTQVITRTWTATDDCGNSTSADQTLTVVDTTDPTLNMPANATVQCGGDTTPAGTGTATGSDTCGGVTITSSDAVVAGCGNTQVITRTWTATDDCGNSTSADQIITVVDTTAPMFTTAPANTTVECDGMGNTAQLSAWLATAAASDTCGGVTITNDFTALSDDCGATGAAIVTWTATDDCGNFVTTSATFTIEDTTPPDLTAPPDQTFECDGEGNTADIAMWTGSAVVVDGCGAVTVTNNYSELTGSCGEAGSAEVTFTATDECNNSTSRTATITIVDTTPPTLACPPDIHISLQGNQCSASGVNLGQASAGDNCSTVVPENDAPSVFEAGDTAVTWTATDACGNTSTCEQHVVVEDASAPVLWTNVHTALLWPPNHNLVNVGLNVVVNDACDEIITPVVRVYSDEDDVEPTPPVRSPDAKNIAPSTLRLRSQRYNTLLGRVYLVITEASDDSGNTSETADVVVVPGNRSPLGISLVVLRAALAQWHFALFGTPPPGFFLVGDGPVIGSPQ